MFYFALISSLTVYVGNVNKLPPKRISKFKAYPDIPIYQNCIISFAFDMDFNLIYWIPMSFFRF